MAATYTFTPNDKTVGVEGHMRMVRGVLSIAGTYTNPGGDALTPAVFGLNRIYSVDFLDAATSIGQLPVTNDTDYKVKLFRYDGASAGKANLEELANAVACAGTVRVKVVGV